MKDDVDLEYRPGSYFRPQRLERYLLSKVKGAVVKQKLRTLLDEGRLAEVRKLLDAEGVLVEVQKCLESVHPMFMGGNYLPDAGDGEVEIARIRIASTTHDVTSVYAKADDGIIRYRVVDEYGGDTLTGETEMASPQPLTLGELADFFLGAWPLMDVLEMNFEDEPSESLGFFSAESEFYPDFDRLCRERVIEYFGERMAEDGAEEDEMP